jgi:hypothetical protein
MLELFAEQHIFSWCFNIAQATGPVPYTKWKDSHHKILITFFILNTDFVTWHKGRKTVHGFFVTQQSVLNYWRRAQATGQVVYVYLQKNNHKIMFVFHLLNTTF